MPYELATTWEEINEKSWFSYACDHSKEKNRGKERDYTPGRQIRSEGRNKTDVISRINHTNLTPNTKRKNFTSSCILLKISKYLLGKYF